MCILRKRDTEIFEKVLIYKKVKSLNELHFLLYSLILVKFIPLAQESLIVLETGLDSFFKGGFLNARSRCIRSLLLLIKFHLTEVVFF